MPDHFRISKGRVVDCAIFGSGPPARAGMAIQDKSRTLARRRQKHYRERALWRNDE